MRRLRATPLSQLYEARLAKEAGGKAGAPCLLEALDGVRALPAALAAFERDLGRASSPLHPYVLPLRRMSALPDGTPIALFDLPGGQTLEQRLCTGEALPLRTALGLVMGIADVLAEMHTRGVSHGALTAEHVFLVPREGCSIGLPRLHGFGFGWLRRDPGAPAVKGQGVSDAERAADLAGLATLAERLMAAAVWQEEGGDSAEDAHLHEGNRRVSSVLTRALRPGNDAFATPLSFALALESAVATPQTMILAAVPRRPKALMPAVTPVKRLAAVPEENTEEGTGAAPAAVADAPPAAPVSEDLDDDLLVPARSRRVAVAVALGASAALAVALLAFAPSVSGQGRAKEQTAAQAAPLSSAALELPPPSSPGVSFDEVAAGPQATATAVVTVPAARTPTLPRARRGLVWSARLGRVVPVADDLIAAESAGGTPVREAVR